MAFHYERELELRKRTPDQKRAEKERRVLEKRAHAALVYDGQNCIGWCQFGPTGELPRIDSRRNYAAVPSQRPDWRITCFFVDRNRRREGVAVTALKGALAEITRQGGGFVEAFPFDTTNRAHSGSFNWGGTTSMFEREGFTLSRKIAPSQWVMTRRI